MPNDSLGIVQCGVVPDFAGGSFRAIWWQFPGFAGSGTTQGHFAQRVSPITKPHLLAIQPER